MPVYVGEWKKHAARNVAHCGCAADGPARGVGD